MEQSFKITSGKVAISDPCYSVPSLVLPALNGDWVAKVDMSFGAPENLYAYHVNYPVEDSSHISESISSLPVDAGIMGFRDASVTYNYMELCDFLAEKFWRPESVYPVAYTDQFVISRTNYGDGYYPCYVSQINGEVVAIRVDFIGLEDEDEDY